MKWNRLLILPIGLLLAGCARVPREAGFSDVQGIVAERGIERVHWNQGTAADRDADTAVRSLLSKELTADTAVQIALLNNRNLQATYEDLGVAQADVVQAGLLRNPVFDAEIRFAEGGHGTNVEMAVTQDFIDLFYIPLRKKIAETAFERTKQQVAGAVMDLAAQTRVAFLDYQAAEQVRELRQTVVKATEASYDLAKRLNAAGNMTDLALADERALYEQSKLDAVSAEVDVVQSRERLNTLMGVWGLNAQWKATHRLADPPAEDMAAEGLEKRAIERSLDLNVFRTQITASARTLGLQKTAGLIPEAEIGLAAEREAEGEWAVGPAFSLPIPLFDQGQAAVARAQAELRRSRAQYVATAIEVRSQLRTTYGRLTAARSRAAFYRQTIIPLRREITERTQLQYNAMQVGAFQLIQAKQAEIDAGVDYIGALREYWTVRTQLDQLTNGRLTNLDSSGSTRASGSTPRGRDTGGH